MKCLNVNDPVIKRLLGFIPSEPLVSKLIDEIGDNFTEQQVLDRYKLLNKNDVTASELLKLQEITKDDKSAFDKLVADILSDVKSNTSKFVDTIMTSNQRSNNPFITAFMKTFKNIGYGAMLKHYNTMILAEDRPLGTEYHEAFHAYENNMFSPTVRDALYKRVGNLTNEVLSPQVASERLAEMYRVYAVNRKLSESISKAEDKTFFQKILDFMNQFFDGINKLFEADEKYSKETGKNSLKSVFDKIYTGQVQQSAEPINDVQRKELLQYINLSYANLLRLKVNDIVRYFTDANYRNSENARMIDGTNASNIDELIYGSVNKTITMDGEVVPTILESINLQLGDDFDMISKVNSNYRDLIISHKAQLANLSESEVEEQYDEMDRTNEFQDVTASEINEKLKIKDFLKFALSSIPNRKGGFAVKGTLGLEQSINFNDLHEELHVVLAGSTNYQEMLERIDNAKNEYISHGVNELLRSTNMLANNTLSKFIFENAFFDQYSKQDNKYISHLFDSKTNILNIVDLRQQQAIANVSGNVRNAFTKLLTNSAGVSLADKFVNLHKKVKDDLKAIKENNVSFSNRVFSLLAYIGYNVPTDVAKLIPNNVLSEIDNRFSDYIVYGVDDFRQGKNLDAYKSKGFMANGNIVAISDLLTPYLNKSAVFSFQNPDNKRQYSIQQWTFLDKAIKEYNEQNPDAKLNTVTSTYFKKTNSQAIKVNKLNDSDLALMNIKNAKSNIVPYIFTADKSTYVGIEGLVVYSDTVSDEDKIKFYNQIIKDEVEQYLKFNGNGFHIEPNYFAISSAILSDAQIKEIKDTVIDNDSFNNMLDLINTDVYKTDILNYARKRENELESYLSKININLKDIKVSEDSSPATIEGLNHFFTQGFYKQTQIITGDLGFYKRGDDFLKRSAGAMGAKASLRLDESYIKEYNSTLAKGAFTQSFNTDGTFRSIVVDDIMSYNFEIALEFLPESKRDAARKAMEEAYEQGKLTDKVKEIFKDVPYALDDKGNPVINVADAQGYVHIDSLRFQLISENRWSHELEDMYQKDLKVGLSTKEYSDFSKAISTKKPQYYGWQKLDDNTRAMTFYKTSLFPMTRTFAKSNKMISDMMSMMETNNVNFVFMESANKVGRKKLSTENGKKGLQLFDENGNINKKQDYRLIQTTYWKYWGTQLDVDDKIKEKQTIGTQMRKLIFGNLKTLLGDNIANNLWNKFNNIEIRRVMLEKKNLDRRIMKTVDDGNGKSQVIDKQKLLSILEESMRDRNMSTNAFNEIRTLLNEDTGLDLATNRLKIESLLYSMITNNLIKPKVDGTSQPQIASAGITNLEFGREDGTIITQTNQGLEQLKFYPLDAKSDKYGMEVYLPNYLKGKVDIDNIDSRLLQAIGFRIPTQGHNSIERIIIKGFLPENQGNAIVVPKEMTHKAGSDFDIDKLNLYLPAFYKTDEGYNYIEEYKNEPESMKEYAKYLSTVKIDDEIYQDELNEIIKAYDSEVDVEDELIEYSDRIGKSIMSFTDFKIKQINNASINLYGSILSKKELRPVMLKPNSDAIIKSVSKESENSVRKLYGNSNSIPYSNLLTLKQHIVSKTSFLAGKFTLGGISLHATHHAISQYSDLKLKGANPIMLLNNESTILFNRTKDTKGRWINNNIEEFQNASVDVAKDDYIADINLTFNTGNTYMYLIRAGVPIEQAVYFMSQPILQEYSKLYNEYIGINSERELTSDQAHSKAIYELKRLYSNSEINRFNLTEENLINQIKNRNNGQQLYVLQQFEGYYKDASYLFELMNTTNFDTKSVGGNQVENEDKIRAFNNLLKKNNDSGATRKFVTNNISDNNFGLLNGLFYTGNQPTFIKAMYDVVNGTRKYFNNLFMYNRSLKYKSILNVIKSQLTSFDKNSRIKLTNRLVDDFITFTVQNSPINNLNADYSYYTKQAANDILSIQESKTKLLNSIDNANNLDTKNNLLREFSLNPLFNNVYLDSLSVSSVNGQFVIDYKNGTSFDVTRQEELHKSFDELYQLRPDLATNIILHNLFQSGLGNSPSQLKNGIPNNYLFDIMANYYNEPNIDYSKFPTLFILNNYSEMLDYHNPEKARQEDYFDAPKDYYYTNDKGVLIIQLQNAGTFKFEDNQLINRNDLSTEINGIYRKDFTLNKVINTKPLDKLNTNAVLSTWFKKTTC